MSIQLADESHPLTAIRRQGVVTDLTNVVATPPTVGVQLGGDTTVTVQCAYLESYGPALNDIVYLLGNQGDYLVVGSVGHSASLGLVARTATTDGAARTATTFAAAPDLAATASFTFISGRWYRVIIFMPGLAATFSSGNGNALFGISMDNGTQVGDTTTVRSGISASAVVALSKYESNSLSGAHTFAMREWCGASVTSVANSGTIVTTVEDLGWQF